MLEEKQADLDREKQRKLLERLVAELSRDHFDLYYQSTSEIAFLLESYIQGNAKLTQDERALLAPLTRRDIEIKLSLHSGM
ncbi:conserved hypothetical protein [Roseibium sp. TrichSKD4]|uniref:hypothetical protein n=1 Tax=Roseibium sp. TrichSKD4 TaxID=744980 RepID=UPI0001E56F6E|nr:hypothetical protein [Roseibium sp. TrichSKD4]EFO30390.1 conserved hypothetical protein [Roseibium sp. TrichSKD4]